MYVARRLACRLATVLILLVIGAASSFAEGEVGNSVDTLTQALSEISESSVELDGKLEALQTQLDKLLNPETSALQQQLTKSANVVSEHVGNTELSTQVTALHTAVIEYQKEANKEAYLASLLIEIAAILPKYNKDFGDALFEKLVATANAVENAEAQRSVAAVTRRAERLVVLLGNTRRIMTGNELVPQLAVLQKKLQEIEVNDFFKALLDRISRLDMLLKPNAVVLPRLRPADQKALADLVTEIGKVLPKKQEAGTHVVSAYWGRLSGPQSAGGGCDVTAAMRKVCEGKPNCQLPTKWPTLFCGGRDPAPFAESIHKGLLLRYICLSADAGTWNAVLAGRISLPPEEKRLTAVLRNVGDQTLCRI